MTPALGAFGVTATNGWKAWVIRAITRSDVNHAFVYVGPMTFDYNGQHYYNEPAIVEANPSGAALAPVNVYPHAIWSPAPPDNKGQACADAAIKLIGTPYSWVDDACIGLAKLFGWHVPETVRKRLNRVTRLQCSQLADTAESEGGWHLFDDGRVPGDVAPSDLREWIDAHKVVAA